MSTKGSLIIRKNNEDKELFIPADAQPAIAGRDAVRMIKSLDLDALYDLLVPEDDLAELVGENEVGSEEPLDFSLPVCVGSVRSGQPYVYHQMECSLIQNSLFCEYGYVLDLDASELHFYIGSQNTPQEGNRYGTERNDFGYYPCRLKAKLPFASIKQSETPVIVTWLTAADEEDSDEIRVFNPVVANAEIILPEKQSVRQLIIARKDLQMSPGKLAAQVSHASMAFIADMLRKGGVDEELSLDTCEVEAYHIYVEMLPEIYNDWLHGAFTKTICEARNKNHLMKAAAMAEEFGLHEGKDYFLIKDNCLTELEPEEYDENGVGRTLTCIGFRPLPDMIAHAISKKYQLYR